MDSAIAVNSLVASIRRWRVEHNGKYPEKIFVNLQMIDMISNENARLNGLYGPLHGLVFMGIALQHYNNSDDNPEYYLSEERGIL